MKRKILKTSCIAPPPMLLGFTQQLQGLFGLVAVILFVILAAFVIFKILQKEKNFSESISKVIFFEIGLLIFAFYPTYHYSKYVLVYPISIAYLLLGYSLLIKFKVFSRNKALFWSLVLMLLFTSVLAYLKIELIGIPKSIETNELTDGIGGCGTRIW